MPLIIGLGNIGSEYMGTRHNVGFDIIYHVADTLGVELKPGRGPWYCAEARFKGQNVVLLTPTTYMNNSGLAVSKALRFFDIPQSDLLVCTDDINLKTGVVRIKPGGSAGGHNGLSDIIYRLQSDQFARLRFGIGNDFARGRQAEYVLSGFSQNEEDIVAEGVHKAHDAVLCFVREGLTKTMNQYN
jgi:peptidyl-tRNA hydrolase, PTH1 family